MLLNKLITPHPHKCPARRQGHRADHPTPEELAQPPLGRKPTSSSAENGLEIYWKSSGKGAWKRGWAGMETGWKWRSPRAETSRKRAPAVSALISALPGAFPPHFRMIAISFFSLHGRLGPMPVISQLPGTTIFTAVVLQSKSNTLSPSCTAPHAPRSTASASHHDNLSKSD